MVAVASSFSSPATQELHIAFLALVPTIETRARFAFAYLKCANQRADKIAEAVALAWKLFVRLHERGKDVATFPVVFAMFIARAVACGRRLVGIEPSADVLSQSAQRKHGFAVTSYPDSNAIPIHEHHAPSTFDSLEERLANNTQTPVPDQAAFRIDFPEWLRTLSSREKTMVQAMMREEGTNDLSRTFGVSAGRISQIRSNLRTEWAKFCGEAA